MTDRDAGYRERIEAADEVRYWIDDIRRGCGPTWYRNKLASLERIERLLRALPLPTTPDDGRAEAVGYLSPTVGDGFSYSKNRIGRTSFQVYRASPASDGAIREALIEARSGLCAYTGGTNGACAETIRRIDAALSAHAGDAAKESGGGVEGHAAVPPEIPTQRSGESRDPLGDGSVKVGPHREDAAGIKPGPPDTHAEVKNG